MNIAKSIVKTSPLFRPIIQLKRFQIAVFYVLPKIKQVFLWLNSSRETTNFTYDLDEINKCYLVSFISVVTGEDKTQIMNYMNELENDQFLKKHIRRLTDQSTYKNISDSEAHYGKRLGWYAFVRVKKPKIVIETGVDKGLGACVLTAALMQNAKEGYEGFYYGTDINPNAGYLLTEPYNQYGKILYGDSIKSLKKIKENIDIFINDSDHSADYEMLEYIAISEKLSDDAIILGDNSHVTNKLEAFARSTNKRFLFFAEKPKQHWYPGGGIGIAFR